RSLRPVSPRGFPELTQGYPPAPVFIMMDGELHEQQRAPWAEGLGPDGLNSVRQHITEQASALLERVTSTGPPTDVMASYVKPLTLSVICDLMGFSPDDQQALGDDTRRAATLAMGYRHRSDEEQLEAARAWVRSQR